MPADAEFARKLFSGPCDFVAGAASLDVLPGSDLPEAAFVGRSNVGKSSLINALVNRRDMARVSKTPGRTRQINLFRLHDKLLLADLPGYGFARVSKAEAAAWNELITGYLQTRRNLRRVMLLLDARRGIMESDRQVMGLLDGAATGYQLVLTKADALQPAELANVCRAVAQHAAQHPAALSDIIATSGKSHFRISDLRIALAQLAA
ncbi:MAG TPA: ribosome biogenesis GTP-binding protein YihA/YsxC [Rhizomicrobium sp.]|nr:ribosome biogenesis GTP-binding protein YihA/YsxC [Rhizomicrobium sp.]